MNLSLEEISSVLTETGLLTGAQFDSALDRLAQDGDTVTPTVLLRRLTADGLLTRFQAQRVGEGHAGELVFGNYLLLNHLGEGGMGDVYKALHRRMQRIVAIKVIKSECASEQELERFRREIQVAARLNHPNIVVAYDADQCDRGDFLVMEYVEGTDLKNIVEETGPMGVDEAVEAIRQAAVGLALAHANGIVHRDIKPANLMRDVSGVVKVADLGLAQMRTANDENADGGITQAGSVMGTIDFMSPEQALDATSVDGRADIYSLGCTLYFLLTGQPVFTGGLMKRMMQHREKTPPSLAEAVDGVSPELDSLFQGMCAKKADDRPESMDAVVREIETLQRRHGAADDADVPAWQPENTAAMLVVDSKLQTVMISKKLTGAGLAEVHTCTSAEDALTRLRTTPVQLVVISRTLPDMSGLQLAERIRDDLRWSQTALLILTADSEQDALTQSLSRMSRVGLLSKSFDSSSLKQTLDALFSLKVDDGRLGGLDDRRVLIADDSKLAQTRVQKVLSDLGLSDFTVVDDGAGVLEHMETEQFDLVVTDYNMPVINGRDVVRFIRQGSRQPDLPVIMVTTEFDPAKLGEIYQLGVSAICGKSFERDQVRNILLQLFM